MDRGILYHWRKYVIIVNAFFLRTTLSLEIVLFLYIHICFQFFSYPCVVEITPTSHSFEWTTFSTSVACLQCLLNLFFHCLFVRRSTSSSIIGNTYTIISTNQVSIWISLLGLVTIVESCYCGSTWVAVSSSCMISLFDISRLLVVSLTFARSIDVFWTPHVLKYHSLLFLGTIFLHMLVTIEKIYQKLHPCSNLFIFIGTKDNIFSHLYRAPWTMISWLSNLI